MPQNKLSGTRAEPNSGKQPVPFKRRKGKVLWGVSTILEKVLWVPRYRRKNVLQGEDFERWSKNMGGNEKSRRPTQGGKRKKGAGPFRVEEQKKERRAKPKTTEAERRAKEVTQLPYNGSRARERNKIKTRNA